MRRSLMVFSGVAMSVLVGACSEKPQAETSRKADAPAWQANGSGFVEPGWNVGEKASWEEQLRSRAQAQNEYAKVR